MKMDHREVLQTAFKLLSTRGLEYGDPEQCFGDAAAIATIMLRKPISKYDVAKVLEAVKLAREAESPHKTDSYVDRVNYIAFACQFAPERPASQLEEEMAALVAKQNEART